jgi:hypothetical protein
MKPVILRPARPADLADMRRWHREQNERDGTCYPLTPIFCADGTLSKTVPLALVGMEGETPVNAFYVELVPELMFIGCNPKATACERRDVEAVLSVLRWQGYSGLNCRVPRIRLDSIRKPLEKAGFRSTEKELVNFFRDYEDNQ